MEELFSYLLKSAGILSIFVIAYHVLLRKLTFFQTNRFLLLFGMLASVTFPLIEITQTVYVEEPSVVFTQEQITAFLAASSQEPVAEPLIEPVQLLGILYIAVVLFFVGKMIVELLSLRRLIGSGKARWEDGFVRVSLPRKVTPFSFFNYICFSENEEQNTESDLILKHEQVHAREWHSVDLLLSHLYCAVFWINPLAWLLKRQIGENLEFIADATAKVENTTGVSYERTLLSSAASHMQPALTNNFFTPFIKKRIQMLQKETSKTWNAYKYALILPVIVLFLYSFNTVTKTEYIKSAVEKAKSDQNASNNAKATITTLPKERMVKSDQEKGDQTPAMTRETIEFKIVATTTKESLEEFKRKLKSQHNVDFDYSNLEYKSGKITSIKIKLDDNRGFKGSQNYNADKPIEPICITGIIEGNSKKWSMGSCGKSKWTSKENVIYSEDGLSNLIYSPDSLYFTNSFTFDTDSLLGAMGKFKMMDMDSLRQVMKTQFGDARIEIDKIDLKNMQAELKKAQQEMRRMNLDSLHDVMRRSKVLVERINRDSLRQTLLESRKQFKSLDMDSMRVQLQELRKKMLDDRSKFIFFNQDSLENSFQIIDLTKKDMIAFQNENNLNPFASGKSPLFIADGKVITEEKMKELSPYAIKSVNVLKGETAVKGYGKSGENGVVVIELHDPQTVRKNKTTVLNNLGNTYVLRGSKGWTVTDFTEEKMQDLKKGLLDAGHTFDLKTFKLSDGRVKKLKFDLDGTTYTFEPESGLKSLNITVKQKGSTPEVSAVSL